MIYVFLMLDNIRHILSCVMTCGIIYLIIVGVISLACWSIYADCGCQEDNLKKFIDWLSRTKKISISIFVVVWLIFGFKSLMPTTRQMAIIYVVPKVANNKDVQKIPANILIFINKYLEESIGDELNKIKDKAKGVIGGDYQEVDPNKH